ncbi:MAG TPA: dihydrolipoamide acetyltransferase family protein [Sphingobium sp.]|uniref:dihydrolipoamide acetyltransferase family protein n=1 Tax=Sphingobium sp. TaxID=1912891 RepID=UPI002ED448D2
MARYTFRLPDIGEGIARAEIVVWHVKPGDSIAEDGRLADMMTDKATIELESPVGGTVVELAGEPGDQIAIGSTLAVIETDEADAPEVSEAVEEEIAAETPGMEEAAPLPSAEALEVGASISEPLPAQKPESAAPAPSPSLAGTGEKAVLASPAVRARARDLGIDLAQIRSEGDHIRHADLDAFLRYSGAEGYAPQINRSRPDETVKVIGLRRRIADAMAESKRHIPHFSYVEEIDMTALEAMRAQLNAHRSTGENERPKLSLLPFLITAICRTVPAFPMMNARYDDEAGIVTRHGSVHMGVATQTEAGLIVPVIRDAQDRNIWQLAREIARLAEAARTGKARSEELSGSTLTISSLGTLGGIASTPVINRPEVAIIAPNRIVERPVFVRNDRGGEDIRRASLMNLSISCDHRVVDGWDAASFIAALKTLLEAPALLFAE